METIELEDDYTIFPSDQEDSFEADEEELSNNPELQHFNELERELGLSQY